MEINILNVLIPATVKTEYKSLCSYVCTAKTGRERDGRSVAHEEHVN